MGFISKFWLAVAENDSVKPLKREFPYESVWNCHKSIDTNESPTATLFFVVYDDDGFEIEHIGNRPRRFRSRINFVTDRTTDTTKRFRMSDDDISFLNHRIGSILDHPTKRNYALSSEQIRVALRYLSTGSSVAREFRSLASSYSISSSIFLSFNASNLSLKVNWGCGRFCRRVGCLLLMVVGRTGS